MLNSKKILIETYLKLGKLSCKFLLEMKNDISYVSCFLKS